MHFAKNGPRHHTQKLKQKLNETAEQSREDVSKISNAKAKARFETTAEVLKGLVKAFDDFEQKREEAWAESTLKKIAQLKDGGRSVLILRAA